MKKLYLILYTLLSLMPLCAKAYGDTGCQNSSNAYGSTQSRSINGSVQAAPFSTSGYTLPAAQQRVPYGQAVSPSDTYYQERIAASAEFLNQNPYANAAMASAYDADNTNGVRRARPNPWGEPSYTTPIGDVPWLLVVLFVVAVAYRTYLTDRRSHKTQDKGLH